MCVTGVDTFFVLTITCLKTISALDGITYMTTNPIINAAVIAGENL